MFYGEAGVNAAEDLWSWYWQTSREAAEEWLTRPLVDFRRYQYSDVIESPLAVARDVLEWLSLDVGALDAVSVRTKGSPQG